jgi:tRNA threonylcarbamoyladenosine biosynthesis protein TsaB
MNLLALDTSTTACTVALTYGGTVVERHVVKAKEHSRLLIPMIEEVLAETGAALSELQGIVLGNGPGSFIGLRISGSVAQGIAFGAGLRIVCVSSLAAVAAEAFGEQGVENVVVAQDAHMDEVYLAFYSKGKHGLPGAQGETVLQPIGPVELPGRRDALPWHAAGGGWKRYPELWQLNETFLEGFLEPSLPRARFLLGVGAAALRAGKAIDPDQLVPDYIRSRVAAVPRKS